MNNHITASFTSTRFLVGDCKVWKLGPLELYIQRSRKEWRVGHRFDLNEEVRGRRVKAEIVEVVPEMDWNRWPASDEGITITLTPSMPDRPLEVRPDAPLTLNPGRAVDFFVGIPAWLSISEGGATPQFLMEVPTRPLSDTWFGDPEEGELCYASVTSARRFIDEMDERPNRIVCPLQVRNDNDEPLLIERICLRTQFLEVFGGKNNLWAPEGRIIYRGINEANQVLFGRAAPPYDEAAAHIGGRKGEIKRGFFAFSLSSGTGGF